MLLDLLVVLLCCGPALDWFMVACLVVCLLVWDLVGMCVGLNLAPSLIGVVDFLILLIWWLRCACVTDWLLVLIVLLWLVLYIVSGLVFPIWVSSGCSV